EGKKVLGKNCSGFREFPILIKFIDAKENLSIQVHPSDDYAIINEGQYGKTEMWYVVDCAQDSYLYYGFAKKIEKKRVSKKIRR
ncbi:MAG: type I phosphomannose isomerase catalytic subunit, partial [Lachnospiraceae bacterium]